MHQVVGNEKITYVIADQIDHDKWVKKKWTATEIKTESRWGKRYTLVHYEKTGALHKIASKVAIHKPFDRWILNKEETKKFLDQGAKGMTWNLKKTTAQSKFLRSLAEKGETIRSDAFEYALFWAPSGFSYLIVAPIGEYEKSTLYDLYDRRTGAPFNQDADSAVKQEYIAVFCENINHASLPSSFRLKYEKDGDTPKFVISPIL
jgi:hypothetical protein